jgi:glycerol kinase
VDESIAGRSLLFNLESGMWDEELLDIFGISDTTLPPLKPTCGSFGEVSDCGAPLLCVIGDQQASLIGHGHQEVEMWP